MEKYIVYIEHEWNRTDLTKIRLSDHTLIIEKRRHQGLSENQRLFLCPFCDNKVETEQHFIMECKTFEIFRQKLFEDITEINDRFGLLDDTEKFVFLLSNPEVGKIISEYLTRLCRSEPT